MKWWKTIRNFITSRRVFFSIKHPLNLALDDIRLLWIIKISVKLTAHTIQRRLVTMCFSSAWYCPQFQTQTLRSKNEIQYATNTFHAVAVRSGLHRRMVTGDQVNREMISNQDYLINTFEHELFHCDCTHHNGRHWPQVIEYDVGDDHFGQHLSNLY